MFASRSDARASTRPVPWAAAFSYALWIAALLLQAHPASGATKAATRTTADSAKAPDDGISVRIVEDGNTSTKRVHSISIGAGKVSVSSEGAKKTGIPEPPEPPDSHANDLVRFGQDIEIPADKVIDGDVVAIGGSVTVYGRVKGDCVAVGGSVSIRDKGAVEGDAVSVGGATTTSDSATVAGSNVSVGCWPFKGAHAVGMLPLLGFMGLGALAGIVGSLVQFLLTIGFAWLCLLLARERMVHAVDHMGRQFGKSFLWGLLGWVAMLVAIPTIAIVGAIGIVILVITIIGIPVAILLAIAMVFALIAAVLGIIVAAFLAYVNGAMYIGRRLVTRGQPGAAVSPFKAIVFGVLLIMGLAIVGRILGFIGVVFLMPIGIAFGIFAAAIGFVFSTTGLGAMMLTRFSKGPGTEPVPSAGEGWYAPPPAPPAPASPAPATPPAGHPAAGTPGPVSSAPPTEGGTSDAP